MTVEAWLLFCLVEAVLCLKPGPSALVVMSLAATSGRSAGLAASAGVVAANAVYFAAAATGLVAAHAVSGNVFNAIKWVGAGYLVWLAGQALWRSFQNDVVPEVARSRTGRPFFRGLIAQGANPNLLVYFGAILPQFVDPEASVAPQVAILAFSSFVIEFSILGAYSAALGAMGRHALARYRVALDRAGALLLLTAAAGVATLSHE